MKGVVCKVAGGVWNGKCGKVTAWSVSVCDEFPSHTCLLHGIMYRVYDFFPGACVQKKSLPHYILTPYVDIVNMQRNFCQKLFVWWNSWCSCALFVNLLDLSDCNFKSFYVPLTKLMQHVSMSHAITNIFVVPPTRLSTVGDRAFPVAAARVWNSLPVAVTSAATLNTIKHRLKTELFIRYYDLSSSYARKYAV